MSADGLPAFAKGMMFLFEKVKLQVIILVSLAFLAVMLPFQSMTGFIKYELLPKDDLKIFIKSVNPEVSALAAEPSNKLVLQVEVRDGSGNAVPKAHVNISVGSGSGEVYPVELRTDGYGDGIVTYVPSAKSGIASAGTPGGNTGDAIITASISGSSVMSSFKAALTRVPVIYVHGYRSNGGIFDNLKEYLTAEGFDGKIFNYKSENSVAASAGYLGSFLRQQKKYYLSRGIQVGRFDVIAHSMGGLVARYYSCSEDYIGSSDIRKLIFVSVPHRGSPVASLGLNYYTDQGIKDLVAGSGLLTNTLPEMINGGLNNTIQTGNIMGQYDEVVGPESTSLGEWKIGTEIFDVGDSSFTVGNLLNGNILEAAIHRNILNNMKVFERIKQMLNSDLPYPAVKKQ